MFRHKETPRLRKHITLQSVTNMRNLSHICALNANVPDQIHLEVIHMHYMPMYLIKYISTFYFKVYEK